MLKIIFKITSYRTQRFKAVEKKRRNEVLRFLHPYPSKNAAFCLSCLRTENWVSPFQPLGQTDKKPLNSIHSFSSTCAGKWSAVLEARIFSLGGLLFCLEIHSSQQSSDHRYAPFDFSPCWFFPLYLLFFSKFSLILLLIICRNWRVRTWWIVWWSRTHVGSGKMGRLMGLPSHQTRFSWKRYCVFSSI